MDRNNFLYCYFDIETQSCADLTEIGAWLYSKHPTTRVMCTGFRIVGGTDRSNFKLDTRTKVTPGIPSVNPEGKLLYEAAANPDCIFVAHNADFEMDFWENHYVPKGYPSIPAHRWKCTMAKCYAAGLPGSLENAAKAMQLRIKKDTEGAKVMKKLSRPRPRKPGVLWRYEDCPEDFQKLYKYCGTDVDAEVELDRAVRDLSAHQQELWLLDREMNRRGMQIDLEFVRNACRQAEHYLERIIEDFREATGGEVDEPSKRQQLLDWSAKRGFKLLNTQAATIKAALRNPRIPPDVAAAFRLLQEAGKTSITKYAAILQRIDNQGIAREFMQHHGAHTGRPTGRGWQPLNLPRPKYCIETVVRFARMGTETFRWAYEDPLAALSSGLRGAIIPRKGMKLFVADYGQIESRILAWLAGEEKKLQIFRDGKDVYCAIASETFGYEVTKEMDERQVGKVEDLSLGFEGGISAFAGMGKNYDVFKYLAPMVPKILASATRETVVICGNPRPMLDQSEFCYKMYMKNEPEEPLPKPMALAVNVIKERFRAAHPAIVAYWRQLEADAIRAVESGKPVHGGKVTWFVHKQFLYCKLPSGRCLSYPFPKVTTGARGKKTLTYRVEDKKQWVRRGAYGGMFAENITQAVEADILYFALLNLIKEIPELKPLMHVYDEVVGEFPEDMDILEQALDVMRVMPDWAEGLPIKVEGWVGYRYGKN